MKAILALILALGFNFSAIAKTNQKTQLIKKMISSCKADLAKPPEETSNDGEAVWKNLEDKENSNVKLSKKCHTAHEKYEARYHKEAEENEKNEKTK